MTEKTRNYLDVFIEAVQSFYDRPALTDYLTLDGGEGNSYTYGEWYRMVLYLCGLFRSLGLEKGDHFAICGFNSANWVVAYLAVAAFGGVAVTLPCNLSPEELEDLIAFSDSPVLIADPDIFAGIQEKKCVGLSISLADFSVLNGEIIQDIIPFSSFAENSLNQPAQICFTTGSVSIPKAVVLSFMSISNNLKNAVENVPECEPNSSIAILPLFHTYGLLGGVLSQFYAGHQTFFLGRNLSTENLVKSLNRINPYTLVIVPSILESMYSRFGNRIKQVFGDGLLQLHVGGAALQERVEDEILALGIPLTVGYGMTETGPLIGGNLWSNYKPHSCGHLVSGMEARVSEAGEILVKGANVMLGYYKNPEATRRKIDADGWLHTGDRGRVEEDGTVYVYGRLEQDMIVLPSGENIIPQNIEALLDRIDGVQESLVTERNGKLAALIFPSSAFASEGNVLEKSALLRAVNIQLPAFSQIADIEFVSEPFQRTGKLGIKRYLYTGNDFKN